MTIRLAQREMLMLAAAYRMKTWSDRVKIKAMGSNNLHNRRPFFHPSGTTNCSGQLNYSMYIYPFDGVRRDSLQLALVFVSFTVSRKARCPAPVQTVAIVTRRLDYVFPAAVDLVVVPSSEEYHCPCLYCVGLC